MSFFKRISNSSSEGFDNKNHKWFVVSSFLFKGFDTGDRVKVEFNNKKYFGYYKFYLFSICELLISVNGEDCHILLDEEMVERCYKIILNPSSIKEMPFKIKKLSNNPNDFEEFFLGFKNQEYLVSLEDQSEIYLEDLEKIKQALYNIKNKK